MTYYESIMMEKYGERYIKYRNIYNGIIDNSMINNYIIPDKLDFPIELDIDLRDACNLRCCACHSINRKRSNLVLDRGLLLKIADECKTNGLCAVNFGGCSEPLLDKAYLIEAIELFEKASVMDIFMHTNAQLLDEETSKRLIEAGLTYFCVSIDAYTSDTYSKMRGGNLEVVLANLENFVRIRNSMVCKLPVVRVSFLPTELNYHEKDNFIEYWRNKVEVVDIQNYNYVENGPKKIEDIGQSSNTMSSNIAKNVYSKKRMSIVAPNLLAKDCGPESVQASIESNCTFDQYTSIKEYWNSINEALA